MVTSLAHFSFPLSNLLFSFHEKHFYNTGCHGYCNLSYRLLPMPENMNHAMIHLSFDHPCIHQTKHVFEIFVNVSFFIIVVLNLFL